MEKSRKKTVMATKKEIEQIKTRLLTYYPDSVTELNYTNLYELLVAVMLSAQCTDKRVNLITPKFFEHYPDVQKLANAKLEEVKALLSSCSFFNNKAKNLISMAKQVLKSFDGKIPLTQKELVTLAGVGQKTANVVLIEYTGANLMAVDTHVFRVAHRLGLCRAKTPKECEAQLTKKFGDNLHRLHQAMVLFGRYRCKALKPLCEECFLSDLCKSKESFKPR